MSRENMTAEQIRAAEAREGVSAVNHMNVMLADTGGHPTEISGWFPIVTAPLDGTKVRVRHGRWEPCHARFIDGCWRFVEFTSFQPTHWQPLPDMLA